MEPSCGPVSGQLYVLPSITFTPSTKAPAVNCFFKLRIPIRQRPRPSVGDQGANIRVLRRLEYIRQAVGCGCRLNGRIVLCPRHIPGFYLDLSFVCLIELCNHLLSRTFRALQKVACPHKVTTVSWGWSWVALFAPKTFCLSSLRAAPPLLRPE